MVGHAVRQRNAGHRFYELETPVIEQYDPTMIPTYPKTIIIEQTGEVKGQIIATAKVIE